MEPVSADTSLDARRQYLRRMQNADGGWGYFPGKQSWLEPTAWAALALLGDRDSATAVDRAWSLIRDWQDENGSWRPAAKVPGPHWTTALAVTLAVHRQDKIAVKRGVDYLLETEGTETGLMSKLAAWISPRAPDRDPNLKAWPWRPKTSSWIEPTAHTLAALRMAARQVGSAKVKDRVRLGEDMILSLRCKDGGWNYGSRGALGVDLPSYPETTGLALIGLAGRRQADTQSWVAHGRQLATQRQSPLASAWLSIALRLHRQEPPPPLPTPPGPDLLVTALETIAAPQGNATLVLPGVSA
jgi:hypothetical protein